jgi:phytoene desaturase
MLTFHQQILRDASGEGQPDPRPHAIVIGSGFGGLAAAIRLGARGWRVTVLERLDQAGGRARVHRQDGFVFDAGPTIVTAPFLFEELWTLCGRRMAEDVELIPLDPFYRLVFDDGTHLDCCADADRMRAEVARLSPGDVAGYERFMREAEAIYRVGFEELGTIAFDNPLDMLRAVPKLTQLHAHRSVHGLVARRIRDPRLRMALSFHPLFIGGNPFSVTAIYCLVAHLERRFGVHFARGGTGALVDGLVRLMRRQGARLRLGCDVARIDTQGSRATGVTLTSGETIAADIVVSNADTAHTYGTLLAQAPRRRWTDRRLARAHYSMGVVVWYFGTNRRYEDLQHHTILFGPRYRDLIGDIFDRKILADDFSLYLHRPTASDPSLAPAGCDAFYALVPVPHLAGGTDWRIAAEPLRQRIEDRLSDTLLPDLRSHIVSSRLTTPLEFERDFLSLHGAAFGMEPRFLQSAWFRPHNRSEDIEHLYLVGAGTHPGAGLPGVLSSAKILDSIVPHATAFV